MRAVALTGPGQLQLVQLPEPIPGPGEILLRVTVSAVCQTDVHITQGHFAIRPPRVLGHELAGEVAALGPGVNGLDVGQPVGVNPPLFCGACAYCRRGQPQQCQHFRCLGNTEDGGWAEYTLIRADQAIPLDGLSPQRAMWLEPLSCVVRALSPALTIAGGTVLVVGAGTLGLLAVQVARAWGAEAVAVVDPNPGKVRRAEQLGARLACLVAREGAVPEADAALGALAPLGFDYVLETTGRPSAMERALRWAGRVSIVTLFGVSDPADQLTFSPAAFFDKELTLRATAGSTPAAFAEALVLLHAGGVDLDALVWRTVGLDELPEVVRALMQPGEKGKVLVDPWRVV